MHPFPFLKTLTSLNFYPFTMTTTPPLSVYLPRSPSPRVSYSNHPTMDIFYPPRTTHVLWWLENADIFISIKGIVYGLRRIHFTPSPLFRLLLSITRPPLDEPFGTTFHTAIPFDDINQQSFCEFVYLLHMPEIYRANSEGWLKIFQIAKDWEMPHVARRATRELDRAYFQNHPFHMRRWDISLYRRVQEQQRRLRNTWVDSYSDYLFDEDEIDEQGNDIEGIIDMYNQTGVIISDD